MGRQGEDGIAILSGKGRHSDFTERGLVFNIQRYQIHDGPGIRTIVFLKGCPLRCLWCSNPEGQNREAELFFFKSRCKLCGKCIEVCPVHANTIIDNSMRINRKVCEACGRCVDICLYSGREIKGTLVSLDDVVEVIERDRSFYSESGGGVTISGGEVLFQPGFSKSILKRCKNLGLHTAIETSGYGFWEDLKDMVQYVNWIFYDIKLINALKHKKYTGRYNHIILENAQKLSELLKNKQTHFVIRIPIIPGYTDSRTNITEIAKFVKNNLKSADEIEILKYHGYAMDKYDALGRKFVLGDALSLSEERMLEIKEVIESLGLKCRYGA